MRVILNIYRLSSNYLSCQFSGHEGTWVDTDEDAQVCRLSLSFKCAQVTYDLTSCILILGI